MMPPSGEAMEFRLEVILDENIIAEFVKLAAKPASHVVRYWTQNMEITRATIKIDNDPSKLTGQEARDLHAKLAGYGFVARLLRENNTFGSDYHIVKYRGPNWIERTFATKAEAMSREWHLKRERAFRKALAEKIGR